MIIFLNVMLIHLSVSTRLAQNYSNNINLDQFIVYFRHRLNQIKTQPILNEGLEQ